VLKKRDVSRQEIGDQIDLSVPQSRLLSLAESDPAMPRRIYSSAYVSAQRNATLIVSKLGMPADYFWKFEYWPKARAFSTLEKIVSRVFASIMAQAKEGNLKITELDIDPLKIEITFGECAECAGISGFGTGICYYHAGTLSGILSGLINRELAGFETGCHACGDDSCRFSIGDREEGELSGKHEVYLSPPAVSPDLVSRMEQSLKSLPVRTLGNMVDVSYFQLAVANSLLADPERLSSDSYNIGRQLGQKLAPVLTGFYGDGKLQNMGEYYLQLGEFGVEIKENDNKLELVIKECAESSGSIKSLEMTSFLTGELGGLTSELTGNKMVLEESRFEGDNLILTYSPAN
jgi:predicted hydrocarbon binding protein